MSQRVVNIVWQSWPADVQLNAIHGKILQVDRDEQARRLRVQLADVNVDPGAYGTRIEVEAGDRSFAFMLRDVTGRCPILVRALGVAVTVGSDQRIYETLDSEVLRRGGRDGLAQIQVEPEESFASAAAVVRDSHSPIWLGLSRDMRTFEVDWLEDYGFWGVIRPKLPKMGISLQEIPREEADYSFMVGRGSNCVVDVTRRLEDGVLPIVHSKTEDGGIDWHVTMFADLETSRLSAKTLLGTHYLVADRYAFGPSHTEEQAALAEELDGPEYRDRDEQVLLCIKLVASNTTSEPTYAWFKAPNAQYWQTSGISEVDPYEQTPGLGLLGEDRVFCVARLNGKPLTQMEMPVLVQPGEQVVVEFYVPHQPVNQARAQRLLEQPADAFAQRHQRCSTFWRAKLAKAARVHVPEKRVDEMIQAGLLHLDMITYGNEPMGALAAMVGRYTPIGTETAPIIQFYDALGLHDLARRSLAYFFEKQRPSGQMQNYLHYQSETGPVLWTAGEHYRYTRDLDWVRSIADKLIKASDFLIDWRRRNMSEELRGAGYGMHDGAVADPKEPTHYFMNAGYTCLGLSRVAEMLGAIGDGRADAIRQEALAMQQDVLDSLDAALARGPVIPLGDGTWLPTCGPFPESKGALSLLVNRRIAVTHSNFTIHDAAVGPLYLMLQEVIEPDSQHAEMLLRTNHKLATVRNVAPAQPYYCRHDYAHLRRGEVKAFLKCYYNTFAALADREVYTFWEHLFRTGVHKTHEEAWFLMQTRWMLLFEEGATLKLLSCVPRQWLDGSDKLGFEGLASYFGQVHLSVSSQPQHGRITGMLSGADRSLPEKVSIRLPHPAGLKAVACEGGRYDADTETVWLNDYTGNATVTLHFA